MASIGVLNPRHFLGRLFNRLSTEIDIGPVAIQEKLFEQTQRYLTENGLMLREGTIVDATIINAPSSTKNREGKRDKEMKQTKKGNQWYFGMKAHVGTDMGKGLVHRVVVTDAAVHDSGNTEEISRKVGFTLE